MRASHFRKVPAKKVLNRDIYFILNLTRLVSRGSNRNSVPRNCSRIARNFAEVLGVYRAHNSAQVKSTCVGNPTCKGIVVNRALSSLHGGSLKITLKCRLFISRLYGSHVLELRYCNNNKNTHLIARMSFSYSKA